MAEFRHELNEKGIIEAVRDISDYFTFVTGESYLKNRNSSEDTSRVFYDQRAFTPHISVL